MTGQELHYIREAIPLSQTQLAGRLGVTVLTYGRWERNQARIPRAVELALMVIEKGEDE